MDPIKISQLPPIGNTIPGNTLVPVVNMTGTPDTQKATIANIANAVLSQAGNLYISAGQANVANFAGQAGSVSNAMQPNITSVGILSNLTVEGLVNLGNVSNLVIYGGSNNQVLTTDGNGVVFWDDGGTYGNSEVANYLPTFTGNVGANWVIADYFMGNAHNLTFIPGANINGAVPYASTANSVALGNVSGIGNIANINLDGSSGNVLYGNGVFAAVAGAVTQDITSNGNMSIMLYDGNLKYNNYATVEPSSGNINTSGNISATGNITANNIGNITPINLDGSSSNVLYGNGVFAPASGGGGAVISNGTSYANVVASDGNVVIGVNNDNMTWTFATDYKIYGLVDEDVAIVAIDDGNEPRVFQQVVDDNLVIISQTRLEVGDFQIGFDLDGSANVWNFDNNSLRPPTNGSFEQYDGNIRMYAMNAGSNPVASLQSVSNQNDPNIFTTIDATTTGANISVYNGGSNSGVGYTWRFDNNGLLTLPGNTVQIGSQYGSEAILASNVAFGVVSQGSAGMTALQWTDDVSNTSQFSAVYINDVSANVGDIQIRTGAVGNANIWKFGNDGNLTLPSNTFAVLYANGTQVSLGGGNTGNVTFDDINIIGTGNLHLQPDPANTGSYLDIFISSGPDLHLVASAAANLVLGKDDGPNVMASWDGNVYIQSWNTGSNTQGGVWNFGEDGNFILANGNGVIQSIANSSLDPTLPNVSTMTLTPDANYNSQVLVLDPTAPGHIHLRAYCFSNIDDPAANIFLGGENTAFEITQGANNQAVIHSNGKAWTFGNDGNISSDTLTFTTTFANVKTVEYQTAGVWDLYVEDSITGSNTAISRLNVSFKDNLIDKPQVYIENTKESDGIALRWTFDENGNLNFPRDVAGNTDPYLNIFGGATPTIQSTDVSLAGPANLAISADHLNLSGYNGMKIVLHADAGEIATDIDMLLTTNLANTGNTHGWTFGADSTLTLPYGATIRDTADYAVAIGYDAGDNIQGNAAVAIGYTAGGNTQGQAAVAIGVGAGADTQGNDAVAIGNNAGNITQGQAAVAIGQSAGADTQGANAVAIGRDAGLHNQAANSIVINATGVTLDNTTENSLVVAPIRNDVANVAEILFYNTTSKEITYGNTISVAGNIAGDNISTTGNISGNTNGFTIGYLNIPQVAASNATLALGDAGKHYYSTTAGNLTLTVPNNATTSFATGTAISIIVQAAGNVLVNAASGVTLYMAGSSSAGNRVVGTYGMATLMKVASDTWFINGTGVY